MAIQASDTLPETMTTAERATAERIFLATTGHTVDQSDNSELESAIWEDACYDALRFHQTGYEIVKTNGLTMEELDRAIEVAEIVRDHPTPDITDADMLETLHEMAEELGYNLVPA